MVTRGLTLHSLKLSFVLMDGRVAMQERIPSVTDYFPVMETLSLIQKKHRERHWFGTNSCTASPPYIWIIAMPSWIFLILLLYKNIYIQEKWEEDPHFRERMLVPKWLEMHFKSNLS